MSSNAEYVETRSPDDQIAIFSLLLYYSCVMCVSQFFQECSENLSSDDQPVVCMFFSVLKDAQEKNEPITREKVNNAIKKAAPTTPQLRFFSSSPFKTPEKFSNAKTPAKHFSHEKLMELKFTKTQLENERYEKNLLETEMKDTEDKIQRLSKFFKIFSHFSQSTLKFSFTTQKRRITPLSTSFKS
jgi:hypothetical protein